MSRARDLADLGGNAATLEKQGLTLVKTASFSAVSSVNIDDVFSSTYDNYRLQIALTTASAETDLGFRFRVSGSDNSNNSYKMRLFKYQDTSISAYSNSTATNGYFGAYGNGVGAGFSIDIFNPFATQKTFTTSISIWYYSTILGGMQFDATTSFTGLTLLPGTGTITGSYSVYGYNK